MYYSLSQKLEALKMFLLATSVTTDGLSLSIYYWKALLEQNKNMQIYLNKTVLLLNPKRMKNMHFCERDLHSPNCHR